MSMQVFLEKLRSLGMAQDCPGSSCAQGDGVAKVRHPFAYVWFGCAPPCRWSGSSFLEFHIWRTLLSTRPSMFCCSSGSMHQATYAIAPQRVIIDIRLYKPLGVAGAVPEVENSFGVGLDSGVLISLWSALALNVKPCLWLFWYVIREDDCIFAPCGCGFGNR